MGVGIAGGPAGLSNGKRINAAPMTINPIKPMGAHVREVLDKFGSF
jgi:hypothetical protein